MSNCKNAKKNMSAYIDNLLSQSEKLSFEEHIKGCDKCKKELAELQEILSLTNNFSLEVPDTFTANVMQKVEKEALHKKKFSLYALPKYATVFAAVFLFAVVLKTPVMNYFEKSYIENEAVQKPSIAYVTKADEAENNRNLQEQIKDEATDSEPIKPTPKSTQKQNSSDTANSNQKQAEDENIVQYDKTEQFNIASRTAFDCVEDESLENKAAPSSGSGMQTAALMPDATIIIHTSITLDEAKIKLETALGYEVSILNNEISLNLSNTEYQSLYNALYEDKDFEGFDNKTDSQSINVVIISNFSN